MKSAAELSAILLRGKHDHTSRHCRGPCFPGRAARADRNSIACQTKCPGRLLQRGWAPQERRSLAWATRWQASIWHDDRRSRARWNADGDHKSSIWFSTTDGARELVCADVALSGNHCELRKRPRWNSLTRSGSVRRARSWLNFALAGLTNSSSRSLNSTTVARTTKCTPRCDRLRRSMSQRIGA